MFLYFIDKARKIRLIYRLDTSDLFVRWRDCCVDCCEGEADSSEWLPWVIIVDGVEVVVAETARDDDGWAIESGGTDDTSISTPFTEGVLLDATTNESLNSFPPVDRNEVKFTRFEDVLEEEEFLLLRPLSFPADPDVELLPIPLEDAVGVLAWGGNRADVIPEEDLKDLCESSARWWCLLLPNSVFEDLSLERLSRLPRAVESERIFQLQTTTTLTVKWNYLHPKLRSTAWNWPTGVSIKWWWAEILGITPSSRQEVKTSSSWRPEGQAWPKRTLVLVQNLKAAILKISKLNGRPMTRVSCSLVSAKEVVRGET